MEYISLLGALGFGILATWYLLEGKIKRAEEKFDMERRVLERKVQDNEANAERLKRAEHESLEKEIEKLEKNASDAEAELLSQYELEEKISKRYNDEANKRIEEYKKRYEKDLDEYKKFTDERIEVIVKDRVTTTVGDIKAQNATLSAKNKDLEERMEFFKKKFEAGKVEIGAEEIKGMLLAANVNGASIVKQLKEGGF